MTETTERKDVYSRITAQIIGHLEKGVRPWVRLWNAEHAAGRITRPLRHNGQPYSGINILSLWMSAFRDGTIVAIGDAISTPIPPGAKVLDLTGHSVLPGFVGMHDHMFYPKPVNLAGERARGVLQFEQQSSFSFPRLYLAAGITSVRTTASVEPYADLNLKSWIDAGKIPGPKIHVTGPYLEGQGNFRLPVHELRSPEDARKTVEFWADQGVTSFKALTALRPTGTPVDSLSHQRNSQRLGPFFLWPSRRYPR